MSNQYLITSEEINDYKERDTNRTRKYPCSSLFFQKCFMFTFTFITLFFVYFFSIAYFLPKYASFTSITLPISETKVYEIITLGNQLTITVISYPFLTHGYGEMVINSGSSNNTSLDNPNLIRLILEHNITIHSFKSEITDQYTSYKFNSPTANWKKDLESFSSLFSQFNFSKFDLNDIHTYGFESFLRTDSFNEDGFIDSLVYSVTSENKSTDLSLFNNLPNSLFNYYFDHYYGKNMHLVLLSSMSLDEMKTIAISNFTAINSKENLKRDKEYKDALNRTCQLPLNKIVLKYKSTHQNKMIFVFIIKEFKEDYIFQSMKFISYLLMKGKNVIFASKPINNYIILFNSEIKKRLFDHHLKFLQLKIELDLTQEGFGKIDEVILFVFKYINYIKNEIKEELYHEYSLQLNNTFNYREQADSQNLIHTIALNMFKCKYNLENILYDDYSSFPFNKTLIRSVYNQLIQDNLIIVVDIANETQLDKVKESQSQLIELGLALEFENKTEKNTNISYYISDMKSISTKTNPKIDPELFTKRLKLNKYINTISDKESIHPINQSLILDYNISNIFDNKIIRMWYKYDNSFPNGRSFFYLKFLLFSFEGTPIEEQYYIMLLFYCELKNQINRRLNEIIQAGNLIEVTFDDNGMLISIEAYTDLIENITIQLIKLILKFNWKKFDLHYLIKQTHHMYSQKEKDNNHLFRRLVKSQVDIQKQLDSLNNFNPKIIHRTIEQNLQKGLIVGLAYGRLSTETVKRIVARIVSLYYRQKHKREMLNDIFLKNTIIHKIIEGSIIFRKLSSTIYYHSLSNYYRIHIANPNRKALSLIAISIINSYSFSNNTECFFNNGISFKEKIIDQYSYFVIEAQSVQCNPKEMNEYIDYQLMKMYDLISNMTNDSFSYHKINTINALTFPSTILSKSIFTWNVIINNNTDLLPSILFESAINSITQAELLTFFEEVFRSSISKLSIQTFSSHLGDCDELIIEQKEQYLLNNSITSMITNDIEKLSSYFFNFI